MVFSVQARGRNQRDGLGWGLDRKDEFSWGRSFSSRRRRAVADYLSLHPRSCGVTVLVWGERHGQPLNLQGHPPTRHIDFYSRTHHTVNITFLCVRRPCGVFVVTFVGSCLYRVLHESLESRAMQSLVRSLGCNQT